MIECEGGDGGIVSLNPGYAGEEIGGAQVHHRTCTGKHGPGNARFSILRQNAVASPTG